MRPDPRIAVVGLLDGINRLLKLGGGSEINQQGYGCTEARQRSERPLISRQCHVLRELLAIQQRCQDRKRLVQELGYQALAAKLSALLVGEVSAVINGLRT